MGTPESAVETRPKSAVGGIALIAIGSLIVIVMLFMVRSGGGVTAGLGGVLVVLGIAALARTNRFRWWQIALIVVAGFVSAALLIVLSFVAFVAYAFRNGP